MSVGIDDLNPSGGMYVYGFNIPNGEGRRRDEIWMLRKPSLLTRSTPSSGSILGR